MAACTYWDLFKTFTGSSFILDCLHDLSCPILTVFTLNSPDRVWLGWNGVNTQPGVAEDQEWWVVSLPRSQYLPTVVGHGTGTVPNSIQGGYLNNGNALPAGQYAILWMNHGTGGAYIHCWGTGAACPLPAPTGLHLQAVGVTTAIVSWNGVPGAVQHAVYRTDPNGSVTRLGTVNFPTVYLQGLAGGTRYGVAVSSINSSGVEGPRSGVFFFSTATAPAQPPPPTQLAAPTNLRVRAVGQTTAIIDWDNVPGAATYGFSVDGVQLGSVAATTPSAFLHDYQPGTTHSFTCVAWNPNAGVGKVSAPLAVTFLQAGTADPCAGKTCPPGQVCVGGTCQTQPAQPPSGGGSTALLLLAGAGAVGAVVLATRHKAA